MATRPQTELNLGQLNLRPTVQGAGRNQVFVAPLPRQNRAQMLAKNLAQFSTVLGQFANVQRQRAEEKALRLTDKQVIDQVESNLPEGFNPFDKIVFDKAFSRKRYDRYYDLKIKDKIQQLSFEIERAGPDKIGNKGFLQDIITDGLGKIDKFALEYIGDNVHMLNRHREVMGQVSAGLRFNENKNFEKGQVDWLKANSVEKLDIDFYDILGQAKNAKVPVASERKAIIPGAIQTAYGFASIDPETGVDQERADRGVPGYEGFSQEQGSSLRTLIPDLSVASNYYPQGTLLNITFEGEDSPRLFRVDDTGGMDTDKKIDFFAAGNKEMYKKFANTKIKSVEYAERNSDTLNHSITKTLQYLVQKHDNDLYNSFIQDPKERVELLRGAVTSAALLAEKNGDIELSEAIELAAPNLTFASGQKLFGSLSGDEKLKALEKAKDEISEARITENTKFINDAVDSAIQPLKTDIAQINAESIGKEIILPGDQTEEIVDPFLSAYDNYITTLNESLDQAEKGGDKTQITISSKALEKTLEDRDSYLSSLVNKADKLHAKTNPIIQFEANKQVKINEIAQQVAKSKALEGTYWQQDPFTDAITLTKGFKGELEQIASQAQRNFYDSSLEKINELNVLNPTIQSTKLIEAGNNLIEQDVKQAMEAISRAWDDKVNSLIPKQGEVSPTDTQFEKQTLEARQSGLTEKQAKDLALATTLKGDETFDIVDEPGKPVEIDVSKPSKGLFNIGNYEIEDLNEYNQLFENTKATGAFKGNKKAVDEFFENRKEIVKEGDFFEPLIDKYNQYVNPSSDFVTGGSGYIGSAVKNLTEIEFQTTRLTINKYIVDNGVLAEDALKGDILGYPLKKLIQRNWDRMPIISEDTPEDVITDIWNKNGLGEEHKIINRAGQEDTQSIELEDFIEAQRKLITDQTDSDKDTDEEIKKKTTTFLKEMKDMYGSEEAVFDAVSTAHKKMSERVGKEKADQRYGEPPNFERITEEIPIVMVKRSEIGGNLGMYDRVNNVIEIAEDSRVLAKGSKKDYEEEKALLIKKVIGHEISHHVLGDTESSISDFLPSKKEQEKLKESHKIKNDREMGQAIGQLKRHLIQYAKNNPNYAKENGFNVSGQITYKILDEMVEKGWPKNEDGTEYIPSLTGGHTWKGKEVRGLLRQLKGWKELNPEKYKGLIKETIKLLPEFAKNDMPSQQQQIT